YAVRKEISRNNNNGSSRVKKTMIMLVLLGSDKACTPAFVNEFARIYSLPTHKHKLDAPQFRRYKRWLGYRNELIIGFTKYNDNYYMVAKKRLYQSYSQYGFC